MKRLKEVHLKKQVDDKIVIDAQKPRNKDLFETLYRCTQKNGGRMGDKRKDYDRNKEKQKARREEE